jgi:hypothetical protein
MNLTEARFLRVVPNVAGEAQWNAHVAGQRPAGGLPIRYG